MKIEEIGNVHRNINCIFPWFKSKRLCEKGIHNYRINPQWEIIPEIEEVFDWKAQYQTHRTVGYTRRDLTNLKCFCCGKEEILEK